MAEQRTVKMTTTSCTFYVFLLFVLYINQRNRKIKKKIDWSTRRGFKISNQMEGEDHDGRPRVGEK